MQKELYEVSDSNRWQVFLISVHGLAIVVISILNWPFSAKILAMCCIAISFFYGRHWALKSNIVQFYPNELGEWQLQTRAGGQYIGQPNGNSFVSPWLVILNFACADDVRLHPVILFRDSMPSKHFRRLRVQLRFRALTDE